MNKPRSVPSSASLLHSLSTAVALATPESRAVVLQNERFAGWFGTGGALDERLPECDWADGLAALERAGAFSYETEIRHADRVLSLGIEMRRERLDGADYLLVEARDISRQKEVEYMLDCYAQLAEQHSVDLRHEKDRVERLLLNVMPRAIYEEVRDFGSATPRRFESASVLMLDFVDFTDHAIALDAGVVVAELNDVFSAFDRIVATFRCERIKAGGDAYMAVAGLPEPNVGHAAAIARAALRMRRCIEQRNASHRTPWLCRIGVHTGPVIGSIVGTEKYVYDIFGPAVNLAGKLETLAEPMQIAITAASAALLGDRFVCRPRGQAEVKGFGALDLWTLEDEVVPAE